MENELSNCSEKLKVINEISEREKIIEDYNRTGFLDRDYAIAKILCQKSVIFLPFILLSFILL